MKITPHDDSFGDGFVPWCPFGVAQALLDRVITHARAMGQHEILLGTTAKFLAAHRFYEKNGFDLVAAENLPVSFPRMVVDTRFYSMTL